MIDIITKRLFLRKFSLDDAEVMFSSWGNDSEVSKYMTWNPHPNVELTKELLLMWIDEYKNENTYRWGITFKDTGELIGSIDVVGYIDGCPSIGYCLTRKHWNKGIMSEALQAVLDYLRFVGYKRILIEAQVENIASNLVIEKHGFKFLGIEEKYLPMKDKTVQVKTYELVID